MTPEQEIIAEEIINLFKKDNGFLDWTVLLEKGAYLFRDNAGYEERFNQQEHIKAGLLDRGLIEIINETGDKSRLTEKGFHFKGFKKTRIAEKIKNFPKQHWYVVALVAYFGGVVSVPVRNLIFPKKTSPDTNQSAPTIPAKPDTNLNHKKNLSLDSLDTKLRK